MAAAVFTTSQSVGDKAAASVIDTVIANEVIIDSGAVNITPVANTETFVDVSFSKTFPSAPLVVVTPQTTHPGTNVTGVGVVNVTTTGCRVYITRTNTTVTPVTWVAVLNK